MLTPTEWAEAGAWTGASASAGASKTGVFCSTAGACSASSVGLAAADGATELIDSLAAGAMALRSNLELAIPSTCAPSVIRNVP